MSATRPVRILIGFNAGIYESIDLSHWIAGNPVDVLATNFSQPPELFEKFPHRDLFVAGAGGPGKIASCRCWRRTGFERTFNCNGWEMARPEPSADLVHHAARSVNERGDA